ncbi:MAG: type I pullulanase [Methanococcaceae archaeon]
MKSFIRVCLLSYALFFLLANIIFPQQESLPSRAKFLNRSQIEIIYDANKASIADMKNFSLTDENGTSINIQKVTEQNNTIFLVLSTKAGASHSYSLKSASGKILPVEKSGIYDDADYYYEGNDLGFTYSKNETLFKVWTPPAASVKLRLFDSWNAELYSTYEFKKDIKGTWSLKIDGDLNGKYYLLEVQIAGKTGLTADPYSKGLSVNSKRSLIFNLADTDPTGWSSHLSPAFKTYTDAIIYEVHVRDFSHNKNSGIVNKNKFLAFTETGTTGPQGEKTGLEHLKELGITHVHLLPVYDFSSIDETRTDQYNWGYDPLFFNVPEGSYATQANGDTRIKEFKQAIKSLHESGLRVVMDVVYNHTADARSSAFNVLVPGYYYRYDAKGNYSNASGCGNEVATERPMVRSFILNSLEYWMKEYKIDGFRFDLLGIYDIETVRMIVSRLRQIDPGVLLYGEPWAPGQSPLPESLRVLKGNQKNLGCAVFNDNIRDAIKGDTQGARPGFVQGVLTEKEAVMKGIEGSINDFTAQPTETINYVSAHDDLCLWDKLVRSSPGSTAEELTRMSKLANGIVLTSQGIPFLHAGEEFARTKNGNHNSFNAGDNVNELVYSQKLTNKNLFDYYKGLIALRKAHPAFRMSESVQVKKHLSFFDSPDGTIGFLLKDNANGDKWKNIAVLYNGNKSACTVRLPQNKKWTIVVNEFQAGNDQVSTGRASIEGNSIDISPVSMLVLYSN